MGSFGEDETSNDTSKGGTCSTTRRNILTQNPVPRSVTDEKDDELVSKWTKIERLPTYNRMRKGLLAGAGGTSPREIDVGKLGFQDRRELLDRLVKKDAEDNEHFLLKLRERFDRVGVDIPTVEIRFENLSVDAKARVSNRGSPSIFNSFLNGIEASLNILHILPSSKRPISILDDICGIIKPGRMTLLLGPPSSGKTTLLQALAGKLGKDLEVSGKVTYNGHEMDEFVPQKTSAYISQTDLHTPEMTVRETLTFSARCQGVGTNYDMLAELLRKEKAANVKPDTDLDIYMKAAAMEGQEASIVVDYIMKILNLENCADIMVGSAMKQGISGGEKKRLTTGEMLVGPMKAYLMDEISTGLDASTTFQIVNAIRQSVHILQGTAVISLLQPAPETYSLFDDIILLSDGKIIYQGPRENVLEFFEWIGFRCPQRKGVADFLQEVTSKKEQNQYWIHNDKQTYRFVAATEFAEAFESFHVGQKLKQDLVVPFNKAKNHHASLATKSYGLNKIQLLMTCAARELLLLRRNSFVYAFKLVNLSISALIMTTVFFRTVMHKSTVVDGGIFMGALFFTLTSTLFAGYSEISLTIAELPILFKQRDLLFFPAWAYSLPKFLLRIPISFIQAAIWVLLTYYETGLDSEVGRFLRQYLILICLQLVASDLYRFIAGLGRSMVVAATIWSCAQVVIAVLGGFVLSQGRGKSYITGNKQFFLTHNDFFSWENIIFLVSENVKSWLVWAYWISPLMYAQNAIAVNEFLGKSWSHVPPNSTESLGVLVLKSRGIPQSESWYWLGLGALFGFCLLFNILFLLVITYLNRKFFFQPCNITRLDFPPLSNLLPPAWGKPQTISTRHSSLQDSNHTYIELLSRQRDPAIERAEEVEGQIPTRSQLPSINQVNQNKGQGTVLVFEPLAITFDEIRYAIDMPKRMKDQGSIGDRLEILRGVSGAFRPGVLTALMGVSGAGKTTLMDVLAGRKTGGYIDGTIRISGYPKKQETFARISGYVEQADIHSPHLTVCESITFSAWLRLSPEIYSATKGTLIEEVMRLVELTKIRDELVGLPGENGLSTEQRKRLTIAVELVANPSIIFMDEPTSGLDARAAAIVMRTVKNTANTGRTIVCTIHQPSIDIIDSFNELLLMKRGGEQIYFGPIGHHACHLINYFEVIKGVQRITDGYNPANWMLEVTSAAQEAKLGIDFAEIYKKSELHRRTKELIAELSTPNPGSKDLYFPTKYSRSFLTQCLACLWKQHWSYWRNTQYNTSRIILSVMLGLILGLNFWDLGSKRGKEQDLFNAMGSMYAAMFFIAVRNASSVQSVVAIERIVFYRERAAGMYSAFPYAFGQVVIELPYNLIQSIISGIILYPMIGFELIATKFLWYVYFMFLALLSFTYYGMMVIAISPNIHISTIICTTFFSLWNLFSGFMIPQTRIPVWWKGMYWASPTAWTLYGSMVSQYGDVKHRLYNNQTVEQFIRSYYGFRHEFLGAVAIIMVAYAVVFAFIFAFSMKAFNFQKR